MSQWYHLLAHQLWYHSDSTCGLLKVISHWYHCRESHKWSHCDITLGFLDMVSLWYHCSPIKTESEWYHLDITCVRKWYHLEEQSDIKVISQWSYCLKHTLHGKVVSLWYHFFCSNDLKWNHLDITSDITCHAKWYHSDITCAHHEKLHVISLWYHNRCAQVISLRHHKGSMFSKRMSHTLVFL